MGSINIQDIAKKAGVSTATVSRVLNHSLGVRPETKRIVEQAIRELDYKPIRRLKNERSRLGQTILVLVPDISMPFYAMIVKGICDLAMQVDCSVITCTTNSNRYREAKFLEMLKTGVAGGAIFLASECNELELMRLNQQFHIVQCCEYREEAQGVSHVSIDNLKAAREAVQHLVNIGHKKIAMLSRDNQWQSTFQREEAYFQILEENGLHSDPDWLIRMNSYDYTSGIRGMNQLLGLKNLPTAVFAISDFMAIGAIQAIQKNEMSVPDNIAVVGFDDVEFASMYTPSITTVYQPQYDLGYTALDLLFKQMSGEVSVGKTLYLEHELRIRTSTVK
ncbi:LacI family DNA-binding transcriptional regulator [Yeguia hominis]|uniref:LacI family DNA-binding transcriptional regulator n=1 Tax=Yeguia hominis TaxID=2763662 RepID=A0A926HTM8_9FIRM|nr:LacI family DNA-binding transcriptional regulator [Yeguia hominis]MBC8535040.1 LacI family DNA-binding transcriptional regulator [Yeguia hominis]